MILGSSNDREVALTKDCQFILTSFPMNERLVFNRTYAGYRGSLTLPKIYTIICKEIPHFTLKIQKEMWYFFVLIFICHAYIITIRSV